MHVDNTIMSLIKLLFSFLKKSLGHMIQEVKD